MEKEASESADREGAGQYRVDVKVEEQIQERHGMVVRGIPGDQTEQDRTLYSAHEAEAETAKPCWAV